jgi:hypothetical protein
MLSIVPLYFPPKWFRHEVQPDFWSVPDRVLYGAEREIKIALFRIAMTVHGEQLNTRECSFPRLLNLLDYYGKEYLL